MHQLFCCSNTFVHVAVSLAAGNIIFNVLNMCYVISYFVYKFSSLLLVEASILFQTSYNKQVGPLFANKVVPLTKDFQILFTIFYYYIIYYVLANTTPTATATATIFITITTSVLL